MSDPYGYPTRIRFGGTFTRSVKTLLIANVAVFAVQIAFVIGAPTAAAPGPTAFERWFALTPSLAVYGLRVWQFITYSFLHDVGNPLHILMNLYLLWMFGGEVEATLGRRRFLRLYFIAALAGGVGMLPWLILDPNVVILGASAAVFGVMAMYAQLFPYRRLLVWGLVPVTARTLVLVLAGLDLFLAITGSQTGTAHLAHLGGFAVGWFYLRGERAAAAYASERRRRAWERRTENEAEVRRKVDELLAKVGHEGLQSLTPRERDFLARAGRRLRK